MATAAVEGREHAGNDVSLLTSQSPTPVTDASRATPPKPCQTVQPTGDQLFKRDSPPEAVLTQTHTLCLSDVTKKLPSYMTLQKVGCHMGLPLPCFLRLQREPALGQCEQTFLLLHLCACSADFGMVSLQTPVRSLVLVVSGNTHPILVSPRLLEPPCCWDSPHKH